MSIFYQNHTERIRLHTSINITFAPHLHRQVELIVLLEGEMNITIDHVTSQLTAGMYALVFPNQLHSLESIGDSKVLICIFDMDFCHNYKIYFQSNLLCSNVFSGEDLSPHCLVATNGLLQLAKKGRSSGNSQLPPTGISTTDTVQEQTLPPATTLALAEGYLTLLMADIFTHIETLSRTVSEDLELEHRILIFLESHYTENLSLDILSKEFGVSRFTLSRLFTEKLHTTFPYYVNSKRLDYACSLLLTTDLSVTQIALDAGFGSSRTFFREFRHAYQVTPREYRKNNQHLYPQ